MLFDAKGLGPKRKVCGGRGWQMLGWMLALNWPAQAALSPAGRQVPLLFEDGGTGARCVARAPGFAVSVSPDAAALWFKPPHLAPDSVDQRGAFKVTLRLLQADTQATLHLEQATPTRINYLYGSDRSRWRTGVTAYERVRVSAAYPGVDVVYYGNDRQLECDFRVAPGADASVIRWAIEQATQVHLTTQGDLVVAVGGREFVQRRPIAYQESEDGRQTIPVAYELGSDEDGTPQVRFNVGAYDRAKPLVIDPLITYVSYFGGGVFDACHDLGIDAQGYLYVVGETASTNFPVENALVSTNRGGLDFPFNAYGTDAFVAKLTPDGNTLVFATYFGGQEIDAAFGMALDPTDGVWVCGLTQSPDFPVTPDAWAQQIHGTPDFGFYQWDAFLAHLDSSGSNLLYSTYIGGSDEDEAIQVVTGAGGKLYVVGDTKSADFELRGATASIRRPYQGGRDLFVVCMEGTNVVYSRLIGGSGQEVAHGIAAASPDAVWLAGETKSSDLPVTNAYQASLQFTNIVISVTTNTAGQEIRTTNAFVLVNSSAGFFGRLAGDGEIQALSYFGGPDTASVNALSVGTNEDLFLTGVTAGTWGPFQWPGWTNTPAEYLLGSGYEDTTNYNASLASANVFVARFDSSGANLIYGTRVVANGVDRARRLAVEIGGRVTIVGTTTSTDFPLANPNQISNRGGVDAFLFRLDPAGVELEYSTYLGGLGQDELYQVVPRPDGSIWVAGFTTSDDWQDWTGVGGFSTNYAGGETNEANRSLGEGLVLRLGPQSVPQLKLVSVGNGESEASWPGDLPPTYRLQNVASLTWTNVTVGNLGGELQDLSYTLTNILTDVVTTNVVGGVTNVVTNAFVTNIVTQTNTILVGGTNFWVTNITAPPAIDRYLALLTNSGGTPGVLTNLGTISVFIPLISTNRVGTNVIVYYLYVPVSINTGASVPVVIGGTNDEMDVFETTPWADYPVAPVDIGGRHTVTVTNAGPTEFFRLQRRP